MLKAVIFTDGVIIDSDSLHAIPYIDELIRDLHQNGIQLIITAFQSPAVTEKCMEKLQLKDYFDGYITDSMAAHTKPEPDIFLAAAQKLNLPPHECLVITASCNEAIAAAATGMTCIGYINRNFGNQYLNKVSMFIEGFEEVDFSFLNNVYQYAHNEPKAIMATKNFILRELTVDDIDDLIRICSDPDINCFLDNLSKNVEEEKEKHIAYIENIYHFYGFGLWGVFTKADHRLVGRCGIEYRILDGEAEYEIGYLLDKTLQGHGYACEFVTAVLDYCFHKLDIPRIVAVIDKRNVRSVHLAEKTGMRKIGECKRDNRECDKYAIIYT